MQRLSAEQVVIGCGHSFDPMTSVVDADGREVCPICFEIGTLRRERDAAIREIGSLASKLGHAEFELNNLIARL